MQNRSSSGDPASEPLPVGLKPDTDYIVNVNGSESITVHTDVVREPVHVSEAIDDVLLGIASYSIDLTDDKAQS